MLLDDLRALGVRGALMVHVSMRAVGGRAEDLLAALLEALGAKGTLVSYVDFEPTNGLFDIKQSPANTDYGIFAEVMRRDPRAVLSANPGARMAAIGARAEWLCDKHPLDYGYGPGSPLHKLVEADGAVLLLGSDFDQVTLLHYAEHLARLPNKRVERQSIPTATGALVYEEFETSRPIVAALPADSFAQITRAFIASGAARSGVVGGATSYLLPAAELVRFGVAKLEELAGDGIQS